MLGSLLSRQTITRHVLKNQQYQGKQLFAHYQKRLVHAEKKQKPLYGKVCPSLCFKNGLFFFIFIFILNV